MKKLLFLLAIIICSLLIIHCANAQAPSAIPYQAIARNTNGNLITSQNIMLRFSIHNATANGSVVYKETQSATTSSLGLFTVNIGNGTPVIGTFSSVNWGSAAKFIQVEMDATGGSNFTDMGTQQMLSVPYALFSGSSAASLDNRWSASGNNIYNINTGNVGIGTSSPSSPLSVQGATNSDQIRIFQNANTSHGWGLFGNSSDGSLNFNRIGPQAGTKLTILDAGNVGIGTTSPSSSAILDVSSTTKGFSMPCMTTAQRDAITGATVGLQIFNTDDQCVNIFDGTHWIETCGLKITGTVTTAGDTWTQKAVFGGLARSGAVAFSIGVKGYIGTGANGNTQFKDFWQYDPATDGWTQKADVGGFARDLAVGFSVGGKGYIGTGTSNIIGALSDFWEYDPVANTWTQKADFGGGARWYAVAFSIGTKGYAGTGTYAGDLQDFWEYDPSANTWVQKANLPLPKSFAMAFTIGSKGYIVGGYVGSPKHEVYEYDPSSNTWTQKASLSADLYRGAAFSIGDKGYVFAYTQLWEYNPILNTWSQKTSFTSAELDNPVAFSIGTKGYLGTGKYYNNSNPTNEFREYTMPSTANIYQEIPPFDPSVGTSSINSGEWTKADNTLYSSNSGNVGIGTSSPSQKLDVNGAVKIGANGTAITNMIKGTGTTSSLVIGGGTTSTQTYTISNAATGSSVMVSPASAINAGLVIAYTRVSASNTVEVSYRNTTGSSITLTAGVTLYITVIQ